MTIAAPTLVEQQTDLCRQLHAVLAGHPAGGAFRLVYAPRELDVPANTVLVQLANTNRGVLELHPRALAELSSGDVLHATQVVDPADTALNTYARDTRASECFKVKRSNGSTGHVYII